MFHPRSLKVLLLVFLVVGSMLGLQGCAPLIFLAANPVITAAVIAAVPAILMMASNAKLSNDQLDVKRLEAETARTNAVSNAVEKVSQGVVAQRQLELDLITKQTQTNDPAIKQQLANLQAKVAQDQEVISQTLNTANKEANSLANDKGPLPGMTSGSTGGTTGATPLTPAATGNRTAPATTGQTVPAAGTTPLTPGVVGDGSGTVVAPATRGIAPRVETAPVVNTAAVVNTAPVVTTAPAAPATSGAPAARSSTTGASFDPTAGGVSPNAVPNSPPVLGGTAPASAGGR